MRNSGRNTGNETGVKLPGDVVPGHSIRAPMLVYTRLYPVKNIYDCTLYRKMKNLLVEPSIHGGTSMGSNQLVRRGCLLCSTGSAQDAMDSSVIVTGAAAPTTAGRETCQCGLCDHKVGQFSPSEQRHQQLPPLPDEIFRNMW